jgi:hypothetical protein
MRARGLFRKLSVSRQLSWCLAWAIVGQSAQAANLNGSQANPSAAYADDTLIIVLKPGADMNEVKEVLNEVHATITGKLHANKDNYYMLFVKPEKDQVDETIKKILGKKDDNFRSISRNHVFKAGPRKAEAQPNRSGADTGRNLSSNPKEVLAKCTVEASSGNLSGRSDSPMGVEQPRLAPLDYF